MIPGFGNDWWMAAIESKPATVSLVYAPTPSSTTASSRTYTSVPYGTADKTRRLLVLVFGGGSARTLTAVTASGKPVSMFIETSYFAAGFVDMPDGSSGDVVVTWSGTKASHAIVVYRTTNLISTTPTDGGFAGFSGLVASSALTVQAGGIAIGYVYGGGNVAPSPGAPPTTLWTGLTETLDASIRTNAANGYNEMHSGAAAAFSEQQAPIAVTATLSKDLPDTKSAYIWAFR